MYREDLSIGKSRDDAEKMMISRAMQEAKRWARNGFGFALLVLGIVAIPTPVPGFLMVLLGLGTLAGDFDWARQILKSVSEWTQWPRTALVTRKGFLQARGIRL